MGEDLQSQTTNYQLQIARLVQSSYETTVPIDNPPYLP